jgi:hypothetical protein
MQKINKSAKVIQARLLREKNKPIRGKTFTYRIEPYKYPLWVWVALFILLGFFGSMVMGIIYLMLTANL